MQFDDEMAAAIRLKQHYDDVTMSGLASQITSLTIVYSTIYPGADQRKHQTSASLALVRGIHRGPVNSPHKWPVTRKLFPFDDVIIKWSRFHRWHFKVNFLEWMCMNVDLTSLKFIPMGPIDNIPALVQITALCRIYDNPLSEPMLTRFTDAYMRY